MRTSPLLLISTTGVYSGTSTGYEVLSTWSSRPSLGDVTDSKANDGTMVLAQQSLVLCKSAFGAKARKP
eukprot:6195172-Pleurochrysis_carterae.AAC.1